MSSRTLSLLLSGLAVIAVGCTGASPGDQDGSGGTNVVAGSGGQAAGSGGVGAGGATVIGTGGTTVVAGTGGAMAAAGGRSGAGGMGVGTGGARAGTGGARTGTGGAATPDAGVADAGAADTGGWRLVWSDEFDVDGAPDPSNWSFEKGFVRNEELQWYQPDNARVSGGMLIIEGRKQQVTNPNYMAGSSDWKKSRQFADYTSSSMTTSGKREFQYGRFEMRARIDTRTGSWPAFWALGAATSWPQSGEVDIMEYYASYVRANVCAPKASTGYDCNWQSKTQALSSLPSNWSSQFHVWVMEWDAQKIDLYLDDTLVNHYVVPGATPSGVTNPFSTKKFFILVNLALGANGGTPPANTTFPYTYEVDYVRVYQK